MVQLMAILGTSRSGTVELRMESTTIRRTLGYLGARAISCVALKMYSSGKAMLLCPPQRYTEPRSKRRMSVRVCVRR